MSLVPISSGHVDVGVGGRHGAMKERELDLELDLGRN
jgi:hypothetical protein